ncbi:MAG: DUF4112 domain-containing protein [Desertifilum sp.]|nr:DUF4112 domain-containing protein [Desertifilum sp.]
MAQPHPPPRPKIVLSESQHLILKRLRRISRVLDNAVGIPGTRYRVGIDPLLGLLPGGGDVVGSALSGYILYEASRLGVPRETLGRMAFNIIVDTLIGTVPAFGDLFDVAWKANAMNLELLESHLEAPKVSAKADKWFVVLLLVGIAIVVFAAGAFTLWLLQLVWRLLSANL